MPEAGGKSGNHFPHSPSKKAEPLNKEDLPL